MLQISRLWCEKLTQVFGERRRIAVASGKDAYVPFARNFDERSQAPGYGVLGFGGAVGVAWHERWFECVQDFHGRNGEYIKRPSGVLGGCGLRRERTNYRALTAEQEDTGEQKRTYALFTTEVYPGLSTKQGSVFPPSRGGEEEVVSGLCDPLQCRRFC
ncbi:hypothetical protein COU80_00140 [Candidatus Peregrinibacteria bacterium CG10_big_fil_rev_8_21_14_0_10_55_24]|nr:MAG: hypothetical protein COU80_00140 [Candidatus Peregrinibacteria bacterium CG10_big_fil_rev_8_21_14_0_10_55_24]